jgi:hypothetical protein
MFIITEADAAAIRAVFNQEGELSAAIELRRRFPGVTDNAKARACAQSIAVDAAASPVSPGDAAASPRVQLARFPSVSEAYAAVPHRPPKLACDNE